MDKPRLSRVEHLRNKRKIVVIKPKDGRDGEKGLTGDRGPIGERGDIGPIGKTGAMGPRGEKGLPGEKGVPGRDGIDGKGITWTGQWEIDRQYSINDGVINFGTAYICTADHKSSLTNQPGVGTQKDKFWAILAERGEAGPGGGAGPAGATGPAGIGLAAGGTTGQILAKNSNADYDSGWEDAPSGLPSQTGNSGKYLTTNGTIASWATVAGGGQSLVTKVVAASGGDYTTLGAAIAAASAGWTIFVTAGAYSESAISSSLDNLSIVGLNPEATVLTFSGALSLTGNNVTVQGMKLIMGANNMSMSTGIRHRLLNCNITFTTANLAFNNDFGLMEGNLIQQTGAGGTTLLDCSGSNIRLRIVNNYFEPYVNTNSNCINLTTTYSVFSNNNISIVTTPGGAGTSLFKQGGGNNTMSGNTFRGTANDANVPGNLILGSSNTYTNNNHLMLFNNGTIKIVTGFNNAVVGNYINTAGNSTATGIDVGSSNNIISSNVLTGNSSSTAKGISVTGGDDNVLIGNRVITYTTGISIPSSSRNRTTVTGNALNGNSTPLFDSGTGTVSTGNSV